MSDITRTPVSVTIWVKLLKEIKGERAAKEEIFKRALLIERLENVLLRIFKLVRAESCMKGAERAEEAQE